MDKAELASVLRTVRSRLTPADVGLPGGHRRQVPGLRREEVAYLAGVSVDYIVRLEQGRGPNPSAQVLRALTRALRLNESDRDLIFRLAGAEPPQAGHIPLVIRPSVLRLLDRMTDLPALVLSAKSDVLACNPLATALFGDLSTQPPEKRNLLWQRFLGTGLDRLVTTPEDEAADAVACVGSLRTVHAKYPDDPGLARLLTELRTGSHRFDGLWQAGRAGQLRSRTVTLAHPQLGILELDCDVLLVPEDDQAAVVYSAVPDTRSASALELLRVTGLEQFSAH
ncbi:helix-turn-helix transcriptional regulator [Nocardia thailandica]